MCRPVQPEQAVETGPIEVDQHRRHFRRIRAARLRPHRVEPGIAHFVVEVRPTRIVLLREPSKRGDHFVGARHQHAVTANEVGVVVDEPGLSAFEPAGRMEIEKDGAAAEERFDVALEGDRIESAERRKQLAFAARPFQQGTSSRDGSRERSHVAHYRRELHSRY